MSVWLCKHVNCALESLLWIMCFSWIFQNYAGQLTHKHYLHYVTNMIEGINSIGAAKYV